MKKIKQIAFSVIIVFYAVSIIGYCIGKMFAKSVGLEYRYWVEMSFRCILWFIPVLLIGILIYLVCMLKTKEKNSKISWLWIGLVILYILVSLFLSFIYMLVNMINLTSDIKMADGNLVVSAPEGMDIHDYYAEPVGIFFRRSIVFDAERTADSLSKIYGFNFKSQTNENGDTVFVSDEYPNLEIKIIRYGYTKSSYLETDFSYILTSQLLEKHREIFDRYGVELATYIFSDDKEFCDTLYGVLITEENKENAAQAITEFIQTTLKEDVRVDGESCWNSVDGSIFLLEKVTKTEGSYWNSDDGIIFSMGKVTKTEEITSFRNIPFSLTPNYWWVYDDNVTSDEIFKIIY
jgi:hypothetical protein